MKFSINISKKKFATFENDTFWCKKVWNVPIPSQTSYTLKSGQNVRTDKSDLDVNDGINGFSNGLFSQKKKYNFWFYFTVFHFFYNRARECFDPERKWVIINESQIVWHDGGC